MFFRSIIFLSAVLFILSCLTGCDANGKSASQLRQEELIAKLNQEKKDREAKETASADYTFEQKEDFLKEINGELAGLQEKITKMAGPSSEAALKEELDLVKSNIEETKNSDASMWEESKRILRKNLAGLKESVSKAEKTVAK